MKNTLPNNIRIKEGISKEFKKDFKEDIMSKAERKVTGQENIFYKQKKEDFPRSPVLRIHASTAGSACSISGQGNKVPHATLRG